MVPWCTPKTNMQNVSWLWACPASTPTFPDCERKCQHCVPGLMAERQHSSHHWSGKGSTAGLEVRGSLLKAFCSLLSRPGGVEVRKNGCSSRPGAGDEVVRSVCFLEHSRAANRMCRVGMRSSKIPQRKYLLVRNAAVRSEEATRGSHRCNQPLSSTHRVLFLTATGCSSRPWPSFPDSYLINPGKLGFLLGLWLNWVRCCD